jgi:hypothetical protein
MASEDPFVNGSEKPDPTSLTSNPGSVDIPRDQDFDGKDEKFALTLMAALDGTSLSVALPVCLPNQSYSSNKMKS